MSKLLNMKLQFFADPNGSGEDGSGSETDPNSQGEAGNQGQGGSEGNTSHSSSSNDSGSGAAKYTQDDINRMLAEKDSEVTAKITSSLADSYSTNLSATVKHEVARANMTADQKRADDAKQAKAHQAEVEAELKSYKAQDVKRSAVATAQTDLTKAKVANAASFAPYVADSDPVVQKSKTSNFLALYSTTAAAIKKSALTPTKSPSTGATGNGSTSPFMFNGVDLSKKDPSEMSFSQYIAYKNALAEMKRQK